MKVDKRLGTEFGVELQHPTNWLSTEQALAWLVGHLVHFSIIPALLGTGALLGRYYPPAIWWFFGFSGAAALCIAALFVVVLIANSMDDPMDGGYPGS